MRNSGKRTVMAAAIAVLLGAMSACGDGAQPGGSDDKGDTATGSWSSIVKQAEKEGVVSFYTSTLPATVTNIQNAFQKKYPKIKLQVLRADSGTVNTRLDQELDGGDQGADVVVTPEILWFKNHQKAGDLQDQSDLPSAADWKSRTDYFSGSYVVVTTLPLVLAWNTDLVKTPLKSYDDLLRPDLKGKIGTLDPVATAPVALADLWTRSYGDDFLEKLAKQDVSLYPSTAPESSALASGEIGATGFMVVSGLNALKGAPVDYAFPQPETLASPMVSGLINKPPHPAAAKVFADYLLSVDGQTALHAGKDAVSPLGSAIPGSLDAKVTLWDPEKFTPDVVTSFKTKWDSLFH